MELIILILTCRESFHPERAGASALLLVHRGRCRVGEAGRHVAGTALLHHLPPQWWE